MLRFSEEIILIALNNELGVFYPLPERSLDFALSSALLMELVLMGRISDDLDSLEVLDDSPTGDQFLDCVLGIILKEQSDFSLKNILNTIAIQGLEIKEYLINDLIEKGIIKREIVKFLWIFNRNRYRVLDDTSEELEKKRLRDIVLCGKKPNQKDMVLLSLVDACRLYHAIFEKKKIKSVKVKVRELIEQEDLSKAISRTLSKVQIALASVVASSGM